MSLTASAAESQILREEGTGASVTTLYALREGCVVGVGVIRDRREGGSVESDRLASVLGTSSGVCAMRTALGAPRRAMRSVCVLLNIVSRLET